MRRVGFIIVLLAGAGAGPRTAAGLPPAAPDSISGQARDYPAFAAPDTVVIEAERNPGTAARLSLLLRPVPAAADSARLGLPSRLPGLEREPVHLSPFARTIYAADRGANAGLFLGGLGNLLGLWDEDTALALTGAGAALGAILHGAHVASGDAP